MKTIERDGLRFKVITEQDNDADGPWVDYGHGPVRSTHVRSHNGYSVKRGGELRLNKDGALYDYQEACKIALRDGWSGCKTREEAAQAARDDYEHLRAFVNGEWSYLGVIVTLLDVDGNETDAVQSLWRVDENGSEVDSVASDLVGQCLHDISAMLYGSDGSIYMSSSRSWRVK